MKQVPYTTMDGNSSIDEAPADGMYAVVRYNDDKVRTRYGFPVDQVFPWQVAVFNFEDGLCDQIASGSSPDDLATRYEISGIYLVDLAEGKIEELIRRFAAIDIELIPEVQTVTA